MVDQLSAEFPVRATCEALNVCFSSFYAWRRKETYCLSSLKLKRAEQVKSVFEEHRRRYGAIRISKELQSRGVPIGRYQTGSLMKKQELRAIQPKSFVPKTTDSKHGLGRSDNLLLERGAASRPNEVYAGDITYIAMADGEWMYLATWQDMYSRMIVGWDLGDRMPTELIINALKKAANTRSIPQGLIAHSDGGGQYASNEFRAFLKEQGFLSSMTRKDNHYDNAMAESLFSRFKAELMDKGAFLTHKDAYTEIFEYIEVYYNRKRRHSGIHYEIPEIFERTYENALKNVQKPA